MKTIAFIGTREPEKLPEEWQALYCLLATTAGRYGHEVVTGAAVGCDQLAAEAALKVGGQVHLILPWENYEVHWRLTLPMEYRARIRCTYFEEQAHRCARWRQSVQQYHPAAGRLSRGAFALHARNYGIIEAAAIVVALPSTKPGGGGTGQGMRIARAEGKKLYDLTQEGDRNSLRQLMGL